MPSLRGRRCGTCKRPLPPKSVLVFDRDNSEVMVGGRMSQLSNAELLILEALLAGHGGSVPRSRLEDAASTTEMGVRVHVRRLRMKIGSDRLQLGGAGAGYRLLGPVKLGPIQ